MTGAGIRASNFDAGTRSQTSSTPAPAPSPPAHGTAVAGARSACEAVLVAREREEGAWWLLIASTDKVILGHRCCPSECDR